MSAHSTDNEDASDLSDDEEYVPPTSSKSKSKPKSKKSRQSKSSTNTPRKRKRQIADSSDSDDLPSDHAHKPLKNKKKRTRKQLEHADKSEVDQELPPQHKINDELLQSQLQQHEERQLREQAEFDQEYNSCFLRDIDEEADNIEQFESELISMADEIEREYKQNHSDRNHNTEKSEKCQEPDCNSLTICPSYSKHFKINVCRECKWKPKYKCVTKSNAKKQYLLSEGDINSLYHWMKEMKAKENQEYRARHMKLYLTYQLEELAIEKWGSNEGIEAERNRREVNRMQRSISMARKKRKLQFDTLADIEVDENMIAEEKKKRTHVHTFSEAVCTNEDTDEWRKKCTECGYVETWEEF